MLVVDEFDRVSDVATRTRLADTIKLLSDRAAPILFIVVGVSENLEELLGRHPSIQRNIVGVPLPLLKDTEIRTLLERGAQDAGLVFPPIARDAIAAFARGVPYIAQLLALHAGYSVLGATAGRSPGPTSRRRSRWRWRRRTRASPGSTRR